MNELQLVLLAFALIVVAVMFFLHQRNEAKRRNAKPEPKATTAQTNYSVKTGQKTDSPTAYKAHKVIDTAQDELTEQDTVPENQGTLSFGEDFDLLPTQPSPNVSATQPASNESRHFVLEVEDLKTIEEAGPTGSAGDNLPSFGRPANEPVKEPENKLAEVTEPQVFVIMVMGTHDFRMDALNKSLLGVGLSYSTEQQIYLKKNTFGRAYLHVANVMEPGSFPSMEEERFMKFTTQGIVLILELPTNIKAPAAMNDMIMIARKVSQRLEGRLYNAQRQLLRESDIQAMRDAAVAYETVGVQYNN